MSTPPNTDATSLGETKKLFAGQPLEGRKMRDLTNTGEVFTLAAEIADSTSPRRITGLSVDEIRAIARLAAGAGVILHCAIELVDASDRNQPKTEVRARLNALCEATRAITIKETRQ